MVPLSAQNATKLGQEDLCTVGVQCLALVVGRGRKELPNNQPNRRENGDKYALGALAHNRAFNSAKEAKKGYLLLVSSAKSS